MADSLESEIASIFDGPESTSPDTAREFLGYLRESLITTEKAIGSDFARMTLAFLAFLVLDSGLVTEVTFVGARITKSGVLLLMFPLVIAFLNYQASCRVAIAQELRTAVALIYRRICPAIYEQGLDVLTHYPSIRTFESYGHKLAESASTRALSIFSSVIIFLIFVVGPPTAIAFCFYRTFGEPTLAKVTWSVSVAIAAALSLRVFFLPGTNRDPDGLFARRKKTLDRGSKTS